MASVTVRSRDALNTIATSYYFTVAIINVINSYIDAYLTLHRITFGVLFFRNVLVGLIM